MTKLKLKMSSDIGDILTREELKHVFGGTGSGTGSSNGCPPGQTEFWCVAYWSKTGSGVNSGAYDCGIDALSTAKHVQNAIFSESGVLVPVSCTLAK